MKKFHWRFFPLMIYLEILFGNNPNIDTGLKFSGTYRVLQENRTLLDLTHKNKLTLPKKFTILFDLSFQDVEEYGILFYLKDDNKNEILLSYVNYIETDTSFLMLSANLEPTEIKIPLIKKELKPDKWFNLSLFFDFSQNQIESNLNGENISSSPINGSLKEKVNFGFGNFDMSTKDVPDVSIRNIKIFDGIEAENELLHHWKLDEYTGNIAADIIGNHDGTQKNGEWLAGKHYYWELVDTVKINFKNNNGIEQVVGLPTIDFYGVSLNDTLYEYKFRDQSLRKIPFQNTFPFEKPEIIFEPIYENYYSFHGGGGSSLSILDTTDWSWASVNHPGTNDEYYTSSRFTDKKGDIFMVGGYGNYRYKNIIQRFNFEKDKWDTLNVTGNPFPFRIGSKTTSGFGKNDVYILAKTGNKTGDQKDGIIEYGEIWHFDIEKLKMTLVMDLTDHELDFDFSYSTIISDTATKTLYFMSNRKKSNPFKLYEIASDFSSLSPVGSRLPGSVLRHYGFDNNSGDIFVIMTAEKGTYNPFILYRLKTPVLPAELPQLPVLLSEPTDWIIPVFIIILLGGMVLFLVKYREKKGRKPKTKPTDWKELLNNIPENNFPIKIIGEFSIRDAMGEDVTALLTPRLRDLFFCILLNTNFHNTNHKGISTDVLLENCWGRQKLKPSINTMKVALSRVRKILNQHSSIRIESKNGLLHIESDKPEECDFILIKSFVALIKENKQVSKELLGHFLILIEDGVLLRDFSNSWLDLKKSEFSVEMVDILLKIAKNIEFRNDNELIQKIGETILKWDNLDEDGLGMTLKALTQSGKFGRAKETYTLFTKYYYQTFENEYQRSLHSFIN